MNLEKIVLQFVSQHLKKNVPFVLALSGGVDSLALFHLLLNTRHEFPFAVAHVDHGWREESQREAQILEKLAESYNLPFHLQRLDPLSAKGNLEAYCREARFQFLEELCEKYAYQGVLTGHHADDRAESSLKKLLEGVPFIHLSSLLFHLKRNRTSFWRPLLNVPKKDLQSWLDSRKHTPFYDETNKDCRFMRAKFRRQVIPFLLESYGKNVNASLLRLAKESEEIKEYGKALYQRHQQQLLRGPFGVGIDMTPLENFPLWELKTLIRVFLAQEQVFLSETQFSQVIALLREKKAGKKVETGQVRLVIDRGWLFHLNTMPNVAMPCHRLEKGVEAWGNWKITVSEAEESPVKGSDWKTAWTGKVSAVLPDVPFFWTTQHPSLAKWLGNAKVPGFFWGSLPILVSANGSFFYEFYTGLQQPCLRGLKGKIQVSLEWIKDHREEETRSV